ncbi:hypothetical protein GGR51DRAFT_563438 [Nemania sp. FL0031]|nr:hypothetical protein GGR51DRAFT_563438 [Nemania sp. FL0031]
MSISPRTSYEPTIKGKAIETETLMSQYSSLPASDEIYNKRRKPNNTFLVLNSTLMLVLLGAIAIVSIDASTRAAQCNQRQTLWLKNVNPINVPNIWALFGVKTAPALETTKPGSILTRFNYTKWSPFNPNRGDGIENVEGNWTRLLRLGMISFTEEELRLAGAAPDAIRLPVESGGGYLGYLASHHYTHCLWLLHMSLHEDFYASRSIMWNMTRERRVGHFDHCIEVLRQLVICDADTTPVTFHWYEDEADYLPDQSNPRRCADWDAHRQWQVDRQVPAPKESMTAPSDYVRRPRMGAPPPGSLAWYH